MLPVPIPRSDSPASGRAYRGDTFGGIFIERFITSVPFGDERLHLKFEFPTAPRLPCRSDNHAAGVTRLYPRISGQPRRETISPRHGQRGYTKREVGALKSRPPRSGCASTVGREGSGKE